MVVTLRAFYELFRLSLLVATLVVAADAAERKLWGLK